MGMWIFILLAILLFVVWNTTLFCYKDRNVQPLQTDDSKAFCEEARSIVLKQGSSKAILLVHGFPSTPHIYDYSSKRFLAAGYDVYAPLLPGFGTDAQAFGNTTFTQWFGYLANYYERLRSEYPTLHVLGISMGGMMTLKLGETYCNTDKQMDKLVSIAAPVVYNSIADGIFTDPKQYIARTLALFKSSFGATNQKGNSRGEDGSEDWVGYGGIFVRPGLSLVHAMKTVRKELGKITCPLFAIHDTNDKTVPFKNLGIVAHENKSSDFKLLETTMGDFNHTRHALLTYHSIQDSLTTTILEFLDTKEPNHAKT